MTEHIKHIGKTNQHQRTIIITHKCTQKQTIPAKQKKQKEHAKCHKQSKNIKRHINKPTIHTNTRPHSNTLNLSLTKESQQRTTRNNEKHTTQQPDRQHKINENARPNTQRYVNWKIYNIQE